jgi:hypothetical protein
MVFTLSSIAFVLVSIIVRISDTSSFPLNSTIGLDHTAREVLTNASAPHFVVYGDAYDGTIGPPAASALKVKLFAMIQLRVSHSYYSTGIQRIASDSQSFYPKLTQG